MSVIVGLVHRDQVWMGADGAVSFGETRVRMENLKMFRKGDMLIGCCGSPRIAQIIAHSFVLPANTADDPLVYLCNDFANALISHLKECQFWGVNKHDEQPEIIGGSRLMIGYQKRLFFLDHGLAVYEPALGYEAIGSGSEIAAGYLRGAFDWKGNEDTFEAERMVRGALYAAAEFQRGVDGPFQVEKL